MSRRDQIVLSPAEQLELLQSQRVVVVCTHGPRGWPHAMPMWFTLRRPEEEPLADGPPQEVWIWTYAKSQKVRNLERDPRATLLIETGEDYLQLRGVQLECAAELIREAERVSEFGKDLTVRYSDCIDSIEGDTAAALETQAAKRVAIRFRAVRAASWDHRKLGNSY